MMLLWRRYSRSGYAPAWFYVAIGAGFAALAVWGLVRADWLVAGIAVVMVAVTAAGSRIMRRFRDAHAASEAALLSRKDEDDG
jgi:hypothetical protein